MVIAIQRQGMKKGPAPDAAAGGARTRSVTRARLVEEFYRRTACRCAVW